VVRYVWLEIRVGGQMRVVRSRLVVRYMWLVNRFGWSDMVWVVRYAWLVIGVGGQICVVGNRCGLSDIRGWK
jgi:hypothetical protein